MQLPSEAITDLQTLFSQELGLTLTEAEVQEEAKDLLRVLALARGQRDFFSA